MKDCSVCHLRGSNRLAWYAAPDCPPRGLRVICHSCERVARRRPVPDYVFHSAPLSDIAKIIALYQWTEAERGLLRSFLN